MLYIYIVSAIVHMPNCITGIILFSSAFYMKLSESCVSGILMRFMSLEYKIIRSLVCLTYIVAINCLTSFKVKLGCYVGRISGYRQFSPFFTMPFGPFSYIDRN